ncbi:MAG: cytochrome b5 domain-containing protein [bacterium]
MIRFVLIGLILAVILSSGCTGQEAAAENNEEPGESTYTAEQVTFYTLEDVQAHSDQGDCWLVIEGKVYDVTPFISSHPGGKAILEGCGIDATELFETRPMGSGTPHSDRARDRLKEYYIGEIKEE